MPLGACLLSSAVLPPLEPFILDAGYGKEMRGVDAMPSSTDVLKLHAWRDGSVDLLIGLAMEANQSLAAPLNGVAILVAFAVVQMAAIRRITPHQRLL